MYRHWPTAAKAAIAKVHEALPVTATLAERRAALRKAGPDFHGYTSHGQKVWPRECRKYLEQHGLPPRSPLDPGKSAQHVKLAAPDIVFPFRGRP